MSNSEFNPKARRSTFELLGELPGQVIALVKAELGAAKAEFAGKAKNIGLGIGLFVVAAVFAFFAVMVLVALAVIALDLVLPLWLAALIVALALLLLAGVLALVGKNRVTAGTTSDPDGVTASIRSDVDALKGVGKYEH
ncbi:phage holin family protein [Cryobacterium cryoconiti]|uniref:Phage holin family protein n=1 Tax=Cryobacterium cryoconiti TaxID=1259239 RepID=A0A4Y8JYU9_9MICO|nr:phage holin family protein [Cryobacterium cryoconiti]TFD32301.1 phage holin family protein [Cryobacterium cryoconiti]